MLTTTLEPLEAGADKAGFAEVVILDDATAPGTVFADPSDIQNQAFRRFVLAVLQTLKDRKIAYSLMTTRSAAEDATALRLVRIPIAASGDEIIAAPDTKGAENRFSLQSPWADLVYDPQTHRLAGTIYWSERQILHDQALRAGMTDTLAAPRRSIPRSAFDAAAMAYADAMPLAPAPARPAGDTPPELQWLFENVPQSTFEAFFISAHSNAQGLMVAAGDCYAGLVAGLIAHGLQGGFSAIRVDERGDLGPLAKWVGCDLKD